MLSLAFIAIALFSLILFYYGTGKNKRILAWSVLWLLIVGAVSFGGYFTNTMAKPPRFLFILLGAAGLSAIFYKKVNANKLNTRHLLAIHALRLPIELVLYQLFLQKKVPILMTFKGWNFDILIGISAIILFLYSLVTKKKLPNPFILIWNLMGLLFLLIIVTIAILSSPLPLQQLALEQPNTAVLHFPFVYLPAYIVPLVFLSHILILKNYHNKSTTANN